MSTRLSLRSAYICDYISYYCTPLATVDYISANLSPSQTQLFIHPCPKYYAYVNFRALAYTYTQAHMHAHPPSNIFICIQICMHAFYIQLHIYKRIGYRYMRTANVVAYIYAYTYT